MEDQINDSVAESTEEAVKNNSVDPAAILLAIDKLQQQIDELKSLVYGLDEPITIPARARAAAVTSPADPEGSRIIEGTFDGQNMTAPDGKQYSVPANYASKSKLIEGDVLKLTITRDGSFIYKQIGPAERQRIIGRLVRDENTGEFRVEGANRSYKVLLASVTYFKGEVGDEVVILVPRDGESRWAAVENVIKHADLNQPADLV